jgi:hypothetical protein
LRKKYAKRGWSRARIERAIEQSKQHSTRSEDFTGLQPDCAQRLTKLCQATGILAFVAHWYNGDVDTEQFEIARPEPWACDEIVGRAASVKEDQLVIAKLAVPGRTKHSPKGIDAT